MISSGGGGSSPNLANTLAVAAYCRRLNVRCALLRPGLFAATASECRLVIASPSPSAASMPGGTVWFWFNTGNAS